MLSRGVGGGASLVGRCREQPSAIPINNSSLDRSGEFYNPLTAIPFNCYLNSYNFYHVFIDRSLNFRAYPKCRLYDRRDSLLGCCAPDVDQREYL
jgi:hypothetical protein